MTPPADIHDQLELYVLGALTRSELIEFDEHLASCGHCRAMLPSIFDTAAELVPDSPAPRRVWERIEVAIHDRHRR